MLSSFCIGIGGFRRRLVAIEVGVVMEGELSPSCSPEEISAGEKTAQFALIVSKWSGVTLRGA